MDFDTFRKITLKMFCIDAQLLDRLRDSAEANDAPV